MDWVPIDYGEVFDKRRPFPNQKGMARALEVDFPPEKKAENSYDLETTGEIFQKLFGDDIVDPEHIAEVKRIMGIKPEASPYACLAEIYAIGSEEEEKMTPHLSCEINGVQCKALCDIRAQVSVLSSKIYDKVRDHNLDLAPTSTKLIMGDGRTIKPLGIACNMKVKFSRNYIPTDFFVINAYIILGRPFVINHDHIILGRRFLKLVDAVLDAGEGKVTMNLNNAPASLPRGRHGRATLHRRRPPPPSFLPSPAPSPEPAAGVRPAGKDGGGGADPSSLDLGGRGRLGRRSVASHGGAGGPTCRGRLDLGPAVADPTTLRLDLWSGATSDGSRWSTSA
jgi:hypothetical protein